MPWKKIDELYAMILYCYCILSLMTFDVL